MEITDTGFLPEFDAGVLTQESMLQIFVSSGTRALAIFRAVSKSWDAFISHKNFMKFYLRKKIDLDYLVVGGVHKKKEKLLMMIKNPKDVLEIEMFDFPVCASGMIVLASCDGFICLSDSPTSIRRVDKMVVWNPVTTEVRAVELPPPKETQTPGQSMGIAYDSTRYDFNVVRIILLSDLPLESLVQTYSLIDESWKDTLIIPFHTNESASIFSIDGVPFWSGCDGGTTNNVICSFDPFNNIFKKIDYPPGVRPSMVHPVNLKNRVSALVLCEDCHVDLFSLDELTSKWVKNFSTDRLDVQFNIYSTRKLQCFRDIGDIVVLGYWHTDIAFHGSPGSSFVPHLRRVISGLQPHWTGPFGYTVTHVKVPRGRSWPKSELKPEVLAQEKAHASSTSNQEVDLDELMDDPELEKLHADRIAALKKEAEKRQSLKKQGHGEYRDITEGDFLGEVTGCEKLICHFYHREFYRCKIMDKHLKTLAARHLETKFIRLDAENAPFFVGKLGIKTLPCVILFSQKIAQHEQTTLLVHHRYANRNENNDLAPNFAFSSSLILVVLEELPDFSSRDGTASVLLRIVYAALLMAIFNCCNFSVAPSSMLLNPS